MSSDDVKAIAERAVKTFFQTLAAVVLAGGAVALTDVDWAQAANVGALAGVLSIITSLASWKVGTAGPSLGAEEVTRHEEVDPYA